jgi:hypothetical protein
MKRSTIPTDRFLISFALCMALLLAGFDTHAYAGGETGSSETAGQPLSAEVFALPLSRFRSSGVLEDTMKTKQWETDFINPLKNPMGLPLATGKNPVGSCVQRGSYNAGTYSLIAELGEIEIPISPIPSESRSHKGGRLSYRTGSSGNSLRLAAFTATNDRYARTVAATERTTRESILAGMSGEFGFFAEKARIATSFVTGGETSRPHYGERFMHGMAGNKSKFSALLDPFAGKIVADAEIVLSDLDSNLADTSGAVHERTCRLKIGGKAGPENIPVNWEYGKLFYTCSGNSSGVPDSSSDADTISGGLRYLKGLLDVGLKAAYSRQTYRTSYITETSATSFSFSPRLLFGDLTISPSLSMNRCYSYLNNLRSDTYAFNLDAKGYLLERKLNYELRGSFRQLESGSSATKQTVATNFKIPARFLNFFPLFGSPSLDIKGEYSRTNSETAIPERNDVSLFVTLNSF